MPPNANEKLADAFVTNAVNIQRFEAGVAREILGLLDELQEDLVAKIRQFDIEKVKRTAFKFRRAEALLLQVRKTIRLGYKPARKDLRSQLVAMASIENNVAIRNINAVFKAPIASNVLSPSDLFTLVTKTDIHGASLRKWWAKQEKDLTDRFSQQMRLGIAGGETNQDLIVRVRGRATGATKAVTVAGKKKLVRTFTGGIMNTSTNEATTLVRTAVQAISNETLDRTYQGNQDVLKGRQALATLDLKTSDICKARDGSSWDFKGKPLPDSPRQEPFPGPPPWHPRCRTVLIPITKSFEELLGEDRAKQLGIKEIPVGTRESLNGQVSGKVNYEEWLRRRSVANQKKALGPGKWELWNDDKITFAQLIDQSGNPLTIDELKVLSS